MSRIAKEAVAIPQGVEVSVNGQVVSAKSKLGQMTLNVHPLVKVVIEDKNIHVQQADDSADSNMQSGTTRALIHNMIVGLDKGFEKKLQLVGVGYRASNQGNIIELALGYTHSIFIQLPPEIKVETKSERNKNPLIILESCDKQLLGQVCSKIRSFRKPEPYKGKGVKFVGEEIRRKSGKSAGAK